MPRPRSSVVRNLAGFEIIPSFLRRWFCRRYTPRIPGRNTATNTRKSWNAPPSLRVSSDASTRTEVRASFRVTKRARCTLRDGYRLAVARVGATRPVISPGSAYFSTKTSVDHYPRGDAARPRFRTLASILQEHARSKPREPFVRSMENRCKPNLRVERAFVA